MKRAILTLAAALGLAPGAPSAKTVAPEQAPRAWVAYAMEAMQTVTARLNADEPPGPRIRTALESTRPTPDQPTPPLVVKLWVDAKGLVTRLDFPPLADPQADHDLRALLQGQRLAPPPRGMRLPMRIALQLPPRDAGAPAQSNVNP